MSRRVPMWKVGVQLKEDQLFLTDSMHYNMMWKGAQKAAYVDVVSFARQGKATMLLSDMWGCTHVQGPMFCQTTQQMKAVGVSIYFDWFISDNLCL